jgi:hypothetical protein
MFQGHPAADDRRQSQEVEMEFLGQRHIRIRGRGLLALAGVVSALSMAQAAPALAKSSRGPVREIKLAEGATTVALSGDGETALLGGRSKEGEGMASVLKRSHGSWTVAGGPFTFRPSEPASIALSEDGSTALVGLPSAEQWGSVAVLTRTGSTWKEQEVLNNPEQENTGDFGQSTALSADGETALIQSNLFTEGPGAGEKGTAYVYARKASVWSQQGKPLTFHTESRPGTSVALSADGDTALIDVFEQFLPETREQGAAAWVFTRSGSGWVRHELKPAPGEAVGPEIGESLGRSVALSADGSTAVVADPFDNNGVGAVWVFKRKESTWTQQGPKLTGGEEAGTEGFGYSAALDADGGVALIGSRALRPCATQGSFCSNELPGATWVFKRKGSRWTQMGPKITCPECKRFGESVALSANASTALISAQK